MNQIYKKSELLFSLLWIALYVTSVSLADTLSLKLNLQKSVTVLVCAVLAAVLFTWMKKHNLEEHYGLCCSFIPAKKLLYYFPLILLTSVNLWFTPTISTTMAETILYILSMLLVGFLEELIFRGFLFKALIKEGLPMAILVSSITFGIGHLVNLVNGSQMDLFSNLLQVIYAMSAGFMFTLLFYCSNSLYACILCHGIFNALSVFANEAAMTMQQEIFSALMLCLITTGYSLYLWFNFFIPNYKKSQSQ